MITQSSLIHTEIHDMIRVYLESCICSTTTTLDSTTTTWLHARYGSGVFTWLGVPVKTR